MTLHRVLIDGREARVPHGATLLDAARRAGIDIPTLCHLDGCRPGTACMVCVVRVEGLRRLVPSCAFPARDGLVVHSNDAGVLAARRAALELLLSEHVGDCEGPCRRGCPAHMNIPLMLRQIAAGEHAAAIRTVKRDIAIPAVLGRICPAPCEKVCRRGRVDQPVAICLLKRFAADTDLAGAARWRPEPAPRSGKTVAIVGAGPAGLSAAFHLQLAGHACTVFDDQDGPGGGLRRAIPETTLPRTALDADIEGIRDLGVVFVPRTRVGQSVTMADLRHRYDAVVLAVGAARAETPASYGVKAGPRGIEAPPPTYRTDQEGVFAVGAAIHTVRMAIRSAADGKEAAAACDQFLRGLPVAGVPKRFNSVIGRLGATELQAFMEGADGGPRRGPAGGTGAGFDAAEATGEARRCLRCDCRKSESCRLREAVEAFGADARRYAEGKRNPVEILRQHPDVVYEPGKCIRCGLCVRLTARDGEALGLGFVNRGFAMRVSTPFGEPLSRGLTHAARQVVEACPTGALAWR